MSLIIWSLMFVIGVSDSQRHRIPNYLVGLLLLAVVSDLYIHHYDITWWLHIKGFLATFAIGFGLYLTRAMAGGDVKLLAVIGLWLGVETMWLATPYIIVASGVIGAFYLAFYVATSNYTVVEHVRAYVVQKVTPGWKSKEPLVIPFAPAVVIGLAYYFYTH